MAKNSASSLLGVLSRPAYETINQLLEKPDDLAAAEKDRDDYKKQLAAMQATQSVSAPAPPMAPRMKAGGKVSSASKRADGCAIKGKTKGRMV